jgi:hypothetical protein
MTLRAVASLACTLAVLAAAGCNSASAPTTPSAVSRTPATIDAFAGTWASRPAGGASLAPNLCSQIEYEVTPSGDGQSGDVRFSGTCVGVTATGTGSGRLSGSTLHWAAEGTGSLAGTGCPFSFSNSTATPEGDAVRVTYSGMVCGIPVSGSQLLTRR